MLGKHLNLKKKLVFFCDFKRHPLFILHSSPRRPDTYTYQTCLGPFQSYSLEYLDERTALVQRFSAIIKLTFYLLPKPCHLLLPG